MKLRRTIPSLKSAAQKNNKPSFWAFDSSSNFGMEDARFLELKSQFRPSGKGRFGKRPLSISLDHGGYFNDSNSNSNDSGIDFNSYESQMSWCGEDAHFGRSSSISNTNLPSHFLHSYGKELAKEETKFELSNSVSNDGSQLLGNNLLDISTARLMIPEKAQIVPNARMSPDSSDQGVNMTQSPMESPASNSPSNSPTSTISPVPMKRARFSYMPFSGKGTGLKLRNQNLARANLGKRLPPGIAPTLTSVLSSVSRDGRVQLQIVSQPEEQHRARYQTEGSRGAIKDKKGNGFPTVKLVGYDKPATLQIFIGTDQGKVCPHMFYQACKVTGKSSTPCVEKKVEGTILIEIEFEPSKDMTISCDCVGILKERNVDVEQRFPFHVASQSRKKSTKCRMVYRTTIINSQGMEETLQLSSSPILCTQPPGHPEICKQSAHESFAKGGQELFVVGKNFLKDTKVYFQEEDSDERILWETVSEPLKDYLQQNHLICVIPPYKNQNINTPVECKVTIVSGGKQSEPHRFIYLTNGPTANYGMSLPISSSSNPVLGQDVLTQSLTQGQIPMSANIHVGGPMSQDDKSQMALSLSPAQRGAVQSTLPIVTSPNMTTMPTLQFPESMHSVQERQVVNELQCILNQSSQQSQQISENIASKMQSTLMSIKTEQNFANIQQTPLSSATVPLDLQFPTEMTPVTTVDNSNVQSQQMAFANQAVSTPQFVPSTTMVCINPLVVPNLVRQASVEMINAGQQMMTELLPNSQVVSSGNMVTNVSAPQTSNVPVTMQSLANSGALGASGVCQMVCNSMGQMPISNQQVANSLASGANMVPQSFVGTGGELQATSGTIANAFTQMSENELMNYINPSCFEPNLMALNGKC